MARSNNCIPLNSPFFKKLTQKYKMSSEEVEKALKVWIDREQLDFLPEREDTQGNKALEEFLDEYFLEDDKNLFEVENEDYEDIYALWEQCNNWTSKGTSESFRKLAERNYAKALEFFDKSNVKLFKNNEGKYIIKIAKPVPMTETKLGPIYVDTLKQEGSPNTLEAALNLVERIMSDSSSYIRKHENFDAKEGVEGSHTYQILKNGKWVNVDTSVTQYIHGKIDIGPWGLPSSKIGLTTDRFVRDYFSGQQTEDSYYWNLSDEDEKNLKEDLDSFRKHLDEKFGGRDNYRVITNEFPISGQVSYKDKSGKYVTKTIAGTMDMLICDKDGNFHIYDMKTSRSGLDDKKIKGYSRQLEIYKAILEANYPEIKGKIKELKLIQFDVYYPAPAGTKDGVTIYEEGIPEMTGDEEALYYVKDANNSAPIYLHPEYRAPRLHESPEKALIETAKLQLEERYSAMDMGTTEQPVTQITETETPKKTESTEATAKQKTTTSSNSIYNNPIFSATERKFIADTIMYRVSDLIGTIQKTTH